MIRRRRSKRNTALRKAIAKVIKWALITLFGWLLFKLIRPYAVEFRGTLLYGGEVMFLGMPLYWAAVESIIKDIC